MTPQEQQMIDGLVDRIRNTPVIDKDVDAEQHLQQGLAGCPDAIYVLAQTVLVQQYGLQNAQTQIQAMQSQIDQLQQQQAPPAHTGGSFLSRIFGEEPQPPAGVGPGYGAPQPPYQPVNNASYPPPPYGAPYPPAYGQPMGYGAPMGGGGFLRGAMQTAAGVAAGEMMFEGMESLFHGFGGGHEGRGFDGGGGGEVVNNYYGDSDHGPESRDDSSFYNPEHDASRGDASGSGGQQFTGTGSDDNNTAQDDDSTGDDTSYDDAGNDDSSNDSGDDGSSNNDDSSF